MTISEIFNEIQSKIFLVAEYYEDPLDWVLEPTDHKTIPATEGLYVVKAVEVSNGSLTECFLSFGSPEASIDHVFRIDGEGSVIVENYYEQENAIIPAAANECYGNYEMYYSKEDPKIGIRILREGLIHASNKDPIARDLGYILRDEGRNEEAIEMFHICEQEAPDENVYWKLAMLYGRVGDTEKQREYDTKGKNSSI